MSNKIMGDATLINLRRFLVIFVVCLLFPFTVLAKEPLTELQKIDALLEAVKTSDLTFIRNGKEYSAKEAYQHLSMKLKNAQRSWFAPPKEKWTAKLFIEKVASRSSLSGKPYLVKLKDGKTIEARIWLEARLKEME